ncbi:hypothetical protein PMIN03_012682 [Paraphaeosphaeria minitans]
MNNELIRQHGRKGFASVVAAHDLIKPHIHFTPGQTNTTLSTLDPTTEESYVQTHQIVALFRRIEVGELRVQEPLTEFQLAPWQNKRLQGYARDKIRCVRSYATDDG